MARLPLPNPAGDLIRRVDRTLESVDPVLTRVDATLVDVDATLTEVASTLQEAVTTLVAVRGLLGELEAEIGLLHQLPEMARRLDELHAVVCPPA